MTKTIFNLFNKKNKILYIFIISLSIIFSAMSSISSFSDIYINQLTQDKYDLYGSFLQVKYDENSPLLSKEKYNQMEYGLVSSTIINLDNKLYNIGTVNDVVNYNDINFDKPEKNEVVVTINVSRNKNLQKNDYFTFLNKKYLIKDVINDYSHSWIKGEHEELNNIDSPKIILNYEDYINLIEENDLTNTNIYYLYEKNDSSNWSSISGNEYLNTLSYGNDTYKYNFPKFYQNTLYILYSIILIIFLIVYKNKSIKRYEVYNILGLNYTNQKILLTKEIFLITTISMILGLILSFITTSFIFHFIFNNIKIDSYKIFILNCLKYILVHITTIIIFSLNFSLRQEIKYKVNTKLHNLKIALSLGIFILLLSQISSNMVSYFENTINSITNKNAYGKMDNNYDFELELLTLNPKSEVFYNNKYHKTSGITNSIYYFDKNKDFNDIKDILYRNINLKDFKSYSKINSLFIIDNDFIDKEYIEKGYYNSIIFNSEFWDGITNKNLLKTELTTYPDIDIYNIANKLGLNDEVRSKLTQGEGVIIVAPPYIYEEEVTTDEYGNEYISRIKTKPASIEEQNITKDETIKVNDSIDTLIFESDSTAYGLFDNNNMKKAFSVKEVNMKVLAKSNESIGWFSSVENSNPYRVIASEKFLLNNGIKSNINRIRFNINESDYDKTNKLLTSVLTNKDQIILNDNHEIKKQINDFIILVNYFKYLLYTSIIISMIFIIYSLLTSYYKYNEENFEIHLLLGMNYNKLLIKVFKPLYLSIFLFIILNFIINLFSYDDLFFITSSELIDILRLSLVPSFIYSIIFCMILVIINKNFSNKVYNQYNL